MLAETLLRRHRGDVVAQQRRETPYSGDMAVKRMGLVLGKHDRLHVAGIHQIAQRKINQTEHAAEWDGRLGPVLVNGIRRVPSPPASTMERIFGFFAMGTPL